jgi:uncharacterized protein (TIGR03067 family)
MNRNIAPAVSAIAACALLAIFASAARADAKSDELAKLKGSWMATAVDTGDGMKDDKLKDRPLKLVFDGDTILAVEGRAATQPATRPAEQPATRKGDLVTIFAMDPAAKPATMDFGPTAKESIKAIYRLDGDDLEICFVKGGDGEPVRPTEFKGGKGVVTFKLKRQK